MCTECFLMDVVMIGRGEVRDSLEVWGKKDIYGKHLK